jgi:hypothetical protein
MWGKVDLPRTIEWGERRYAESGLDSVLAQPQGVRKMGSPEEDMPFRR